MHIIDAHIHCGIQNVYYPYEKIQPLLEEAHISHAVMFAPVEDIYDRKTYLFDDTPEWRQTREKANRYILTLSKEQPVFPYLFVWNDFRTDMLDNFTGIKWHRHPDEPVYNYDAPDCETFLQETYKRKLPIVLEESFENTMYFLNRVGGQTPVIIPHLGGMNGSFRRLLNAGAWDIPETYADTSGASMDEMYQFIAKYGHERLIFGSDYPFSMPGHELQKILDLEISDADKELICGKNIRRLLDNVKKS